MIKLVVNKRFFGTATILFLGVLIIKQAWGYWLDWSYWKDTEHIRKKEVLAAKPEDFETRPLIVFNTGEVGKMNKIWLYDYKRRIPVETSWGKLKGIDLFGQSSVATPTLVINGLDKSGWEKHFKDAWKVNYVYMEKLSEDGKRAIVLTSQTLTNYELYQVQTDSLQRKLVYRYQAKRVGNESYGECSKVIGWDEINQRLYTMTEVEYDSDGYYRNICVIDTKNGGVTKKMSLPNASSKGWTSYDYNEESDRIILRALPGRMPEDRQIIVVDLSNYKLYNVDLSKTDDVYFDRLGGDKSTEYLLRTWKSDVFFYDIKQNKVVGAINFPAEAKDAYLRWTSPNKRWHLFDSQKCVYLVDSFERKIVDTICPEQFDGGDFKDFRFEGWIEN